MIGLSLHVLLTDTRTRRHRHRKEDHVKTLEAEIAELQRLTSVARSEKNRIALENQGIQELLVSCGAPVTTSSPKYNSDGLASINYAATQGPGTIDTLFDSSISTERVCVSHSQSPSSAPPSTGDSWLALDFILALEHPCRNHVQHPSATPPKTPKEANGHALTMTSAVYTRARRSKASVNQHSHAPPSHTQLSRASKERWQIPHSEVEKYALFPSKSARFNVLLTRVFRLIELAGKLDLDPVEMTPAQAYAAVLSNSGECNLQSILSYLKEALAPYANCFGFGAVLPSGVVWQELRAVLDHQ